MSSFLSSLSSGFGDAMSGISSGLNRFGTALLSPSTLAAQDEAKRKAESLALLAPILSGQSIAAYARPDGVEPQTPEQTYQQQLSQLGTLATPEAVSILQNLSPLATKPLSNLEKLKAEADIAETNAKAKYYGTAGGAGGEVPMSVKETEWYNKQTPEVQAAHMLIKRQDPYAKPLPSTIVKAQDDLVSEISLSKGIASDMTEFSTKLDNGTLKLNVIGNIQNKIKNGLSLSDEESRNFNSFSASLEKLRNDSLRLNNGVQTEGDATRAWNELMANINDPKVVQQRLKEIARYNSQAVNLKKHRVNTMRSEYKKEALPETPDVPSQFTPTENIPVDGNINKPIINASEYFK